MTALPVTLFTAAILGLLGLFLSVWVSVTRARTNTLLGDGAGAAGCEPLFRAIRAQGNFVEYVPLILILLGGVEISGAARRTCEIYAGILIVGRILHAIGIQVPGSKPSPLRGIGALATWIVMLGLSLDMLRLLLR